MAKIGVLIAAFVALEHIGFLILEMFLWEKPIGRKVFNLTPETAATSKVLAANQGLYNGFLAAGLIWGIAAGRWDVTVFFLCCVVVAGTFGAATAKPRIFLVQAVPALLGLAALFLGM